MPLRKLFLTAQAVNPRFLLDVPLVMTFIKGRYTRGDMSLQHVTNVAATRRCDKPLLVNRWGDKLLQQLAATLRVYKISDEVEC